MNVIYENICQGKTTQILKRANDLEGYNLIVCINKKEVFNLWAIIIKNKLNIPMPITFNDFLKNNYCGVHVDNILIDNLDVMIQSMTNVRINSVSITKENNICSGM